MHQISPAAIEIGKIFPGEKPQTPAYRGRAPAYMGREMKGGGGDRKELKGSYL